MLNGSNLYELCLNNMINNLKYRRELDAVVPFAQALFAYRDKRYEKDELGTVDAKERLDDFIMIDHPPVSLRCTRISVEQQCRSPLKRCSFPLWSLCLLCMTTTHSISERGSNLNENYWPLGVNFEWDSTWCGTGCWQVKFALGLKNEILNEPRLIASSSQYCDLQRIPLDSTNWTRYPEHRHHSLCTTVYRVER